ncbi:phage tail protein [Pseudomonas congelans]|uniref:phage tail protein n=1 Tax=Pseudomonas congelans TaxID=200452 RepID=UPI00186458BD|nr:phage tail protein [Pseudomonas congelans]
MDYPKSVPGVGLASGKFVDENPATGMPGSLIPAQWGNSITQEILNAMAAGGEQPDETRTDQLASAITQIGSQVRQAYRGAGFGYTASETLLPGAAGHWHRINLAGITLTLPPKANVVVGKSITFHNASPGAATIKANGAEVISLYGAGSNTLKLNAAEWVELVFNTDAIYITKRGKITEVKEVDSQKVFSFNTDTVFTRDQMELLLLDATGGNRAFTLPSSNAALGVKDVIVRRIDSSGNRLTVNASAGEKIRFHTHLNAAGYSFLVLMGAGDWWHLRSDGAGSWWPVGRYDNTPLGRPVFETTTLFSPGGYGALNGGLLNRADWPWLWDHAQKSGMVYTEAARTGKEGGWSSGDGALTFRGPEGRGEFLRVLDESRGVDASRVAGSWQDGTWLRTVAQEWSGSDIETGTYLLGNGHAQADGRLSSIGPNGVLPIGALVPAGGSAYLRETTDNGATGAAMRDDQQPMNNWIRFRSRNMAYPGRIKLI